MTGCHGVIYARIYGRKEPSELKALKMTLRISLMEVKEDYNGALSMQCHRLFVY